MVRLKAEAQHVEHPDHRNKVHPLHQLDLSFHTILLNFLSKEEQLIEVEAWILIGKLVELQNMQAEHDESRHEHFGNSTFDHYFCRLHDLYVLRRRNMCLHDLTVVLSSQARNCRERYADKQDQQCM